MQIIINVKRWHIILICSILVLGFSGIYLALAQNQPVVGHSISEIFGGIFGHPIKLASGHYLGVQGSGDEQVYIGGDAVADDVQIGSFNSSIQKVALWNAGSGNFMDLYVRDAIIGRNLYVGGYGFSSTIKVWKYTGNNGGKGNCPYKNMLIVQDTQPSCEYWVYSGWGGHKERDTSFEFVGHLLVGKISILGGAPIY